MERSRYLRRLALEARWRLPPDEAEEVIADYTELLEQDSRPENELCRDMGTPRQAVRLLEEKSDYRRWLSVFAGLTACLLLPCFWTFSQNHHPMPAVILMIVGVVWVRSWFSSEKQDLPERKSPLPRGLRLLLVLQGAVLVPALASCVSIGGFRLFGIRWISISAVGEITVLMFQLAGVTASLTGLFGLVRARLSDWRWYALYTFGLAVVVFCVQFLALLHDMDPSGLGSDWFIGSSAAVLLGGLLVSVGALC